MRKLKWARLLDDIGMPCCPGARGQPSLLTSSIDGTSRASAYGLPSQGLSGGLKVSTSKVQLDVLGTRMRWQVGMVTSASCNILFCEDLADAENAKPWQEEGGPQEGAASRLEAVSGRLS